MGYWAKLYTDILEDKKVIRDMTDVGQLGMFFAILVAKKNDSEYIGTIDDLAFDSRKTQEFWEKALAEMETVRIVDHKDGIYRLINWEKRQATIDSSERTRQSRARKNALHMENKSCNENVTQNNNSLQNRYGEKEKEKEIEIEIEKDADEDAEFGSNSITFQGVWKEITNQITQESDWERLKAIGASPDDLRIALQELAMNNKQYPASPDRCMSSVQRVVSNRALREKAQPENDYRRYLRNPYAAATLNS